MNVPFPNAIEMLDRPVAAGKTQASDALAGRLRRRLRLTAEEIADLKRQGTVVIERRGTKNVAKLRFRSGGRQAVRYVGNVEAAREVRAELAALQQAHRQARELARVTRSARKAIRIWKNTITPCLENNGFGFYGLQIRRRRKPLTRS